MSSFRLTIRSRCGGEAGRCSSLTNWSRSWPTRGPRPKRNWSSNVSTRPLRTAGGLRQAGDLGKALEPADRGQPRRAHQDDVGLGLEQRLRRQLGVVDDPERGADVDAAGAGNHRVEAAALAEHQLRLLTADVQDGDTRVVGARPLARASAASISARIDATSASPRSGTPSTSATRRTLSTAPSTVGGAVMTTTGTPQGAQLVERLGRCRPASVASTSVGENEAIGSAFSARW